MEPAFDHTIPFRPVPRDFPGFTMPSTVPPGLRLELSRAPIVPGREGEVDEWMTMLTDRYDEVTAALPAERAVFEATFRHREADGSLWIYHLALMGESGGGLDETRPAGAAHASYSRRVTQAGWEELEPMFMLVPPHLSVAMAEWGATGEVDAGVGVSADAGVGVSAGRSDVGGDRAGGAGAGADAGAGPDAGADARAVRGSGAGAGTGGDPSRASCLRT